MTDGILKLTSTQKVYAYEFEGRRYDAGNKQGYLEAQVEYALRDDKLKDNIKKYLIQLVDKF